MSTTCMPALRRSPFRDALLGSVSHKALRAADDLRLWLVGAVVAANIAASIRLLGIVPRAEVVDALWAQVGSASEAECYAVLRQLYARSPMVYLPAG